MSLLSLAYKLQTLKKVERQNLVGVRPESAAEHSWGTAMLAILFHPQHPKVNLEKAIKMALVHDICEIEIGDASHYDAIDETERIELERKTIKKILKNQPELYKLWEEFMANKTAEAQYVQSLDKLEPVIQNITEDGASWKKLKRKKSTVLNYKLPFTIPTFRPLLIRLLNLAEKRGYFVHEKD